MDERVYQISIRNVQIFKDWKRHRSQSYSHNFHRCLFRDKTVPIAEALPPFSLCTYISLTIPVLPFYRDTVYKYRLCGVKSAYEFQEHDTYLPRKRPFYPLLFAHGSLEVYKCAAFSQPVFTFPFFFPSITPCFFYLFLSLSFHLSLSRSLFSLSFSIFFDFSRFFYFDKR